jgi:hypothetical protein
MKTALSIALVIAGTALVQAEDAAFQLSLTPDVALESRSTTIRGVSLGIWNENPQHSFTLGIINGSTGDSSGFSWGVVNYADSYTGVQWAFVNVSQTRFVGWQGGAVNYSQGTFEGLQTGFINAAQNVNGLQLGALNYTESLRGVQIGFLNIVKDNGWFDQFPDKLATVFPIVNWSF